MSVCGGGTLLKLPSSLSPSWAQLPRPFWKNHPGFPSGERPKSGLPLSLPGPEDRCVKGTDQPPGVLGQAVIARPGKLLRTGAMRSQVGQGRPCSLPPSRPGTRCPWSGARLALPKEGTAPSS